MSLATDYAAYIAAARELQIENDDEAVAALEMLLARIAAKIRVDVLATPRGILGERYRRDLTAALDQALDDFRTQYKPLLDAGIVRAAQIVEERERQLLQAVYAQRDGLQQPTLFSVSEIASQRVFQSGTSASITSITFGNVPMRTVEAVYSRTYRDGLKLSQRLYNLDRDARRQMADVVTESIATGRSARKTAAALSEVLTAQGVDNVRNKAMRIARTEINQAFREGHIASVTDATTGQLAPWVEAIGWRLSPSHPRVDICDAWAGDDTEGLGPGNYSAGNVPAGHPRCLCATVTIIAAAPQFQFVSFAPRPSAVPESQRRYYGRA